MAKQLYLVAFELQEYARTLSFENAAERTSQRLRCTSGARVMIICLGALKFKNATQCTSQRLKWTSGARDMIIAHARFVSRRARVP